MAVVLHVETPATHLKCKLVSWTCVASREKAATSLSAVSVKTSKQNVTRLCPLRVTSRQSPKENLKELRQIELVMHESHRAASRQRRLGRLSEVLREEDSRRWRRRLRQLRALRLLVARASISPKSFTIAGTEFASTRSDVDPWCRRRCAPDHRIAEVVAERDASPHPACGHRRSSHEDPVARHESKPSCRHVSTTRQDMQLARHTRHSFVVLSFRSHSQPASAD